MSDKSNRGLMMILGCLGVLAAFSALALGGLVVWTMFFRGAAGPSTAQPPAAQVAPGGVQDPGAPPTGFAEYAPPVEQERVPLSPSAPAVVDSHGVGLIVESLMVPPSDPEEPEQTPVLVSYTLDPGLVRELSEAYEVVSAAYAVESDAGAMGRGEMMFPAASPQSRVAVLIDNTYLAVLDDAPVDGKLAVKPYISGAGTDANYPVVGAESPVKYMVLTPKSGSLPGWKAGAGDGVYLTGGAAYQDPDGNSCISLTYRHCWRDPTSSIFAYWVKDFPDSLKDQEYLRIVDLIKAVRQIMDTYQGWGLTGAAISRSVPVHVVVSASVKEPHYSPRNGVIYVPWDIAANAGNPEGLTTLAHEMFHWIQDVNYRMLPAFYSGPKSWWLEMTAELATFWLTPEALGQNLSTYGIMGPDSGGLALQYAPLKWDWGEAARYIQAQAMYVNVCDEADCALSREGVISAINAGSFPFSSGDALSRYQLNAGEVARYLLGAAPERINSGITFPPAVRTGENYGDYLVARTSPRGVYDFGLAMEHFKREGDKVTVSAKIERGGVYPLVVSNSGDNPFNGSRFSPGLPMYLKIEPGAAFWIRIGDAEPVYYGEGQGLTIAPISAALGVPQVRVAAFADTSETTFKAEMGLIDLTGDLAPNFTSSQVVMDSCEDDEGGITQDPMLNLFSGIGTWVRDPSVPENTQYIWEIDPAAVAGEDMSEVRLESKMVVGVDDVRVTYRFEMLPPQDSSIFWPLLPGSRGAGDLSHLAAGSLIYEPPAAFGWLLAGGLAALAALAFGMRPARVVRSGGLVQRYGTLVIGGLLFSVVLGGCFGLAFWGTFQGEYRITGLEYIDSREIGADDVSPVAGALWRITAASGSMNTDFTVLVATEEDEQEEQCFQQIDGRFEGYIMEDGIVTFDMGGGDDDWEDDWDE